MIRPGQSGVVHFNTHAGGVRTDADTTTATVWRNDSPTVVPAQVTRAAIGHYVITFVVPSNWQPDDRAYVVFEFEFLGQWNSCTKDAGPIGVAGFDIDSDTILERLLDLLEADETFDSASGKARKLLRGTNVVLLEKDVAGTTCTESVALTE